MDPLSSQFIDWYKQRSNVDITNKNQKQLRESRRNNRNNLLMERRRIHVDVSPEVQKPVEKKNPRELRFLALKQWKEKRNKEKLEKKANQKPIFKVHHISIDLGGPDLEFINKTIKGKRFDVKKKIGPTKPVLTTMGFKATNIYEEKKNTGISSRLRSKTKPAAAEHVLKSTNIEKAKMKNKMTKQIEKVKIVKPVKQPKTPNKANNIKKKPNVEIPVEDEYCSPIKPLSENINILCTPPVNQELANAYVSPFVTISRGKTSARKEYKIRRSQGGLFDVSDHLAVVTGNKAGAAHFHQLLNDEIARIEKMCDNWLKYKDEKQPPVEACDVINTTIGQSQLLLNKKFQQFRGLIVDCQTNNSERIVTCSDLHGYWEMLCLQVDNVNKRFENLEKFCNNNWEEIIPVVKKPQPKKKIVKKAAKPRAESALRDLIKAKRLKVKEEIVVNENIPPSPSVSGSQTLRKSLRTPFKSSNTRKRNSSVSLTSSKTLSVQKQCRKTISADSTPAKSILKTPNTKSKKKKLVLFRADAVDIESPPLHFKSRRSSRRVSTRSQDQIE